MPRFKLPKLLFWPRPTNPRPMSRISMIWRHSIGVLSGIVKTRLRLRGRSSRSFPAIPAFSSQISLDEITSALKKSNPHNARGPDGWSVAELRSLPDPFLLALRALLNLRVEVGEWRDSVLWSSVSMFSKTEEAFQIEHTRPITVLSAFYRLWEK